MLNTRPYCLSIAGFDPSAGAGVLADIKTFEQNEVYGLGISTALTYQNDNEFRGVKWHCSEEIKNQLMPLLNYKPVAVKIGLIESLEALEQAVRLVRYLFGSAFIVWDPILKATAGYEFHTSMELSDYLKQNINLLTPNFEEFNYLRLNDNFEIPILLKGGHRESKKGTDTLIQNGRKIDIYGDIFNYSVNKHGTGCVLSSAICANIAKGMNVLHACQDAKAYVERFILSNKSNLGYHS